MSRTVYSGPRSSTRAQDSGVREADITIRSSRTPISGRLSPDLAFGPGNEPTNVVVMLRPDQHGEQGEQLGFLQVAIPPQEQHAGDASEQAGERRVAGERGDDQPDDAETERRLPGECDQDPDIGRHAL